ncbi:unnamed protein product [Caretta caretta]
MARAGWEPHSLKASYFRHISYARYLWQVVFQGLQIAKAVVNHLSGNSGQDPEDRYRNQELEMEQEILLDDGQQGWSQFS